MKFDHGDHVRSRGNIQAQFKSLLKCVFSFWVINSWAKQLIWKASEKINNLFVLAFFFIHLILYYLSGILLIQADIVWERLADSSTRLGHKRQKLMQRQIRQNSFLCVKRQESVGFVRAVAKLIRKMSGWYKPMVRVAPEHHKHSKNKEIQPGCSVSADPDYTTHF